MSRPKKISTFRSFKNRNYSLFFGGQSLSLIGTWMQRTGVSWLVYSTTHSAFMLGFTVFASQFPSFLLSLFGGVVADRYNRYKILLLTQFASMIQAAVLAVMTLTDHYTIDGVIILSVLLGVINAFDVPARQPLIHELISDKEDLPNALALNSSMVNIARIAGPALSGIVLQQFGAGICFLLNALSFLAVLTSLFLMRLPKFTPVASGKKIVTELREGFTYMKTSPSISSALLMLCVVSLLVLPYDTLIPVFAKVVFSGDAATFGYISSFMGLGAISGTLFLASLKKGANLKRVLLLNTLVQGTGLIFFSHITYLPVALVFAVISGFGAMSQTTICITIVQVSASQEMRGRMMSFVAMAYFGMLPLGSLIAGGLSQYFGAPNTLLCQGTAAILIGIAFTLFLRNKKLSEKARTEMAEAEQEVIEKI